MKLFIQNAMAFAGVWWLYDRGYVGPLFRDDGSPVGIIIYIILAIFAEGLIRTFVRGYEVSKTINRFKSAAPLTSGGRRLRTTAVEELDREAGKLHAKMFDIHAIADNDLIMTGIIGTAIGLLVIVVNKNIPVDQLRPALFEGLFIGLKATLVGFVLSLWTSRNYRILYKAVEIYRADVRV